MRHMTRRNIGDILRAAANLIDPPMVVTIVGTQVIAAKTQRHQPGGWVELQNQRSMTARRQKIPPPAR